MTPVPSAPSEPSDSLAPLASLCIALRATTKRLEKAALVGEYVSTLNDRDLVLACRYLTARPFAAYDPRNLRLGPQAVFAALLALVPSLELATLRRRLVELGDLPSVTQATWREEHKTSLTLLACHQAMTALAAPKCTPKERQQQLSAWLAKATSEEAGLLVGIVTRELRLGLSTDALLDALARLHERPLTEAARLLMLSGDIGETALLLRRHVQQAKLRPFHSLGCMLASPLDMTSEKTLAFDNFVAQDKYDGIRAQVHVGEDLDQHEALPGVRIDTDQGPRRLVIFSRTHEDVTTAFPDIWPHIVNALPQGPHAVSQVVLDAELLGVLDNRPLPFLSLQARLGRKAPSAALQQQVPVTLFVFDVLAIDGALCIDTSWQQRNEQLTQVVQQNDRVVLAPSCAVQSQQALQDAFAAARARGHEGLVLKDKQSLYTPGKRGRQWRKVKVPQATFDVVVVSCEVGFGRKRQWLSDLTFAVRKSEADATLMTIGKAYSGLTDQDLIELTPWFEQHTKQVLAHGKVRIVEPNVVLEVACDRVQESKRHKSGFALRFARIVRVRRDKQVEDIDTLDAVRAAAEQHAG